MNERCLAVVGLGLVLTCAAAPGQPPGGADAALEAYQRHEELRRGDIAAQIETQEFLRFRAGLPDRRLYYGGLPGGRSLRRGFQPLTWSWDGVFEPWPVPGGRIYGYRYDNPVEQPAGDEIRPLPGGGYVYGPVYERPPVEGPIEEPLPEGADYFEELTPPPLPVPAGESFEAAHGPREF